MDESKVDKSRYCRRAPKEKSAYQKKIEAFLAEAQAENKYLKDIKDAAVALKSKRISGEGQETYTTPACWTEFEALWTALDAYAEAKKKGSNAAVVTK